MADFQYTPPTGWNDETEFPDYPTAPEVRPMFQKLFNQIRDAFNAHAAESATLSELGHIIVDGETIVVDENGVISSVGDAETTDRTITVGVGKDFATIQEAIDSLKKRIDANITINVDAGTYAEDVLIKGFVGGGILTLQGGSNLATAENFIINSIELDGNSCMIDIRGFTATSIDKSTFSLSYCILVRFYYCRSVTSAAKAAFYIGASFAHLSNCLSSNRSIALSTAYGACVSSNNWTAGSDNTIGLNATGASTIGKNGTQPQGTTAESATQGGAIR